MKKISVIILLAAMLFAAFSIVSSGAVPPSSDNIAVSNRIYVYNIDSKRTVFEKNSDEAVACASTAKLMTAILAYEYYDGKFDTVLTVSETEVNATVGNSIELSAGEQVTVDELLTALIAGGANDAANVFAYEIGGSIGGFCDLMNEKAIEIGAKSTFYKNACGIDAEGMKTTAHDVALISAYAYNLSSFSKYAQITRYVMPATNKSHARIIQNRNYLISTNIESKYYNSNAVGMNSGYTENGGQCVVTAAFDKGLTYIIVVMDSKKNDSGENCAFFAASELIDYTIENFGYLDILEPDEIVREVPVRLAKNVDYVIVSPEYQVEYFLPLDTDVKSEITYETRFDGDSITAPVYEGQKAGEIDVIYKNEVLATVPLVAKNSVSASTFLKLTDYCKNLLKSRQVKIALSVFAVIFIAYLFLSYMSFVRRHRKRDNFK